MPGRDPWRSETSNDIERIRQVCEDVFNGWQAAVAHVFTEAGIPEADALLLATFVLSSYEGASTMSRALRDNIQPMLTSGAPRSHRCCTRTSATHPACG